MFASLFKNFIIFIFLPWLILLSYRVKAQPGQKPSALYEQASEVSGKVIQYGLDINAVKDFYSPYSVNLHGEDQYVLHGLNSPEQRKRLVEIDHDYLKQLEMSDFEGISIYGQVDYLLLKKRINNDLYDLEKEDKQYLAVSKYLTFANDIYALEQQRRHGAFTDGEKVALQLTATLKQLKNDSVQYSKLPYIDMALAKTMQQALLGLKSRLAGVYDFYNGYDPMFSWWVPKPYQVLINSIAAYSNMVLSKGKLATTQKPDSSGIKGVPIGRQELMRQLQAEMIPYTPDELIVLANKEFAWCNKEMLKASREMGFGDDWKKALEKVKNSYVPVGHQPELILKLYNDAVGFIKSRDLITIPPLAEETWGMVMMSPERQLVNPFFTGGKEISISYPTNTMQMQDKLMSMRGNNPYFSRGTVQHELIPGHNLQYFMNSRYKAYRQDFATPFAGEGWALYWELLLYDKGFAKTPEERVGMLFWRMHRCARIIFSLNYHLGNWAPQQCIDFLINRVGHEKANAEGEVRRSFEGGYSPLYQVAYLLGGLQIMALKTELVDSGKMSYKSFHDAVMKENLIPVEMLRATLTNQHLSRDFTTSWKFYNFN
ncbi:DUF885 family protein [Mucilaginibacter phyllosphaerae]|uniref:DUF885 family protein n=1 Tax=Mucilaginibacter phyllosphaerae TaxID=1812349 RepID=A0A4Y8AAY2_9SPHI|nr:DUF885 family protein [Mucilaginibacter phyllosphaerae]MBB3969498.1 hypothetical protein [Mucilaginibacter phyllosphaerae]TEW65724.1 DUF885 family protein [Mucilaginibacter phyllosphaerae]GGH08982.1 X-Pro dipeptidyl-peptidase [Mucilaginibacter phyllosphaerae]